LSPDQCLFFPFESFQLLVFSQSNMATLQAVTTSKSWFQCSGAPAFRTFPPTRNLVNDVSGFRPYWRSPFFCFAILWPLPPPAPNLRLDEVSCFTPVFALPPTPFFFPPARHPPRALSSGDFQSLFVSPPVKAQLRSALCFFLFDRFFPCVKTIHSWLY